LTNVGTTIAALENDRAAVNPWRVAWPNSAKEAKSATRPGRRRAGAGSAKTNGSSSQLSDMMDGKICYGHTRR